VQFTFQDKNTRDNVSVPYSVTLSQNKFEVSQLLLKFIDGSFSDKILNEINSLLSAPIKLVINNTFSLLLNHLVMPKVSAVVTTVWNVIDSGNLPSMQLEKAALEHSDIDLTMLAAGVAFLND